MNPDHTLLIVDDEPNVIKSLRRLLIDTDYNLITADSAETGLKVLETEAIQLVISDYRMPGMSGIEFLNIVKEKYPDTYRMIMSGYTDTVALVEAINDGQVYRFITKPWNDHELLTSIMRAFDQYNLGKENARLHTELQARNCELQEMTRTIEENVIQKTSDQETNTRTLKIAQTILNSLPVGVLGIDSKFDVIFMSDGLSNFIDNTSIVLGTSVGDKIDKRLIGLLRGTLGDHKTRIISFGLNNEIGVISIPLVNTGGVIALFTYLDLNEFINPNSKTLRLEGEAKCLK
jgi:FixJ family two-component response regulator